MGKSKIIKKVAVMLIGLFMLSGCATDKNAAPNSGTQTAAKKAPDFSQKEIQTEDGHIIKLEGGDGGGFVRSYKNGKKDGITAIYKNGVLYGEISYRNGILHGLSRNYYFPLSLIDVNYVDGKKHGVAKEWCDGRKKLKLRENYNYGKLDGLSEKWTCDEHHYRIRSIEYKNGKMDGIYKSYDLHNFKNGKIFISTTYKDDKKDGIYKMYHNGKLNIQSTYKGGVLNGEYKMWDHNGKLARDTIYKNGREFDRNGNFIPTIVAKD